MSKLTTLEAAKFLGISKKTFLRWDKLNVIPVEREASGARLYRLVVLENVKKWLDLRRRHKEHLHKLGPIRGNLERFISRKPLEPFSSPELHKHEDMKKAYDDLHDWEQKIKKIYEEYAEFTEGFYGKLEK